MKSESGKRESRREHNPVTTKSEEAARIASTLAPLEEQRDAEQTTHDRAHRNGGAIIVDTGPLKLPKDFIEEGGQGKAFGLEPVVIFILALALAFIAFITYLISIESAK